MATYLELRELYDNSDLTNKVAVAVAVAAHAISLEDPVTENHANRLVWAKDAFSHPDMTARNMLKAVLAANKNASVATILGATDAAIQANVDAAVNVFAGAA